MGTRSVLLLILCAALATAQEDHSQHQHAVAGLGTVDFRTSCNAAAQALIVPVTKPSSGLKPLAAGAMRHPDHRFEWTRAQFRAWAGRVADRYGYRARFLPVGP
jgi:hypothetical protein